MRVVSVQDTDTEKPVQVHADERCTISVLNFLRAIKVGRRVGPRAVLPKPGEDFFSFFSFNHYSYATYLDCGEITYSPFPVCCPRSGGTLQAPPLPSAPACPQEKEKHTKKITKERKGKRA